ncbi:BnaA02g25630D [Brassica napus]|uniref:glycerophosphodiester phosphodiesterase n=1 Tax=Brassica napus TaxID=3708 RepID=A0A078GWA7_BRANA|nr:BnaA02g25630D [Brassica napus]
MYRVDKDIQNVTDSAINAILSFAGTIVISMNSVLPYNRGGLVRLKKADVVPRLKVRGVRVFVNTFSNEFVTQPLDLFSDSTVEVDFFFQTAKIDGIITELRVTSARYKNKQLHFLPRRESHRCYLFFYHCSMLVSHVKLINKGQELLKTMQARA